MPMTYDCAMMIPLHEMCSGRFKYVSDILYIHNLDTPLNDHKVDATLQSNLEIIIRNMKKYQPLTESRSGWLDQYETSRADVIIFSRDNPEELKLFIQSMYDNLYSLGTVNVLYTVTDANFQQAYDEVAHHFASVYFIKVGDSNFKSVTLQTIANTAHEHIIFMDNNQLINKLIHLPTCMRWIEQTQAYAYYLNSDVCTTDNNLDYVELIDAVNVWQLGDNASSVNDHVLDLVLYKKADLYPLFKNLAFNSPSQLRTQLKQSTPVGSFGLYSRMS